MMSKFAVSAKMLASGAAILAFSSGMALAQSAAPACIGSQSTDCVPSGGVNGTTGTTGTQNPNGVLMTPGETPNGLRTTPGTNGMTTGTGPGIGTLVRLLPLTRSLAANQSKRSCLYPQFGGL